jgi:putative peptidoglycan lipid II flippase
VGLFVLAEPVIRLIYEHGRFGPDDTADVAAALRAYAAGICFYAGVKAAAPLFLARGDTRTPMVCSLLGIGVNLAVALAGIGPLGFRALALAVAAGTAANYGALRWLAVRRGEAGSSPGWGFLARTFLAAGAMGGAAHLIAVRFLARDVAVASRWGQGALLLGGICLLGTFYFLVAKALGIEESRSVLRRLTRRKPGGGTP